MLKKIQAKFKGTVLVVDDYPANLELMRIFLELMQCSVLEACSGEEAIEVSKTSNIDLILMDIQMPKMDGVEASNEIKKFLNVPVIALTAHAISGDKEKYLSLGFSDYISKPITGESIELLLTEYLERIDT